MKKVKSQTRYCELLVGTRDEADWGSQGTGGGGRYYRRCSVDGDGTVRAWDEVAGHYSRHHDLTPAQILSVRNLAK